MKLELPTATLAFVCSPQVARLPCNFSVRRLTTLKSTGHYRCARRSPTMTTAKTGKTIPVLMTDILDTVVADPFRHGMAQHLGFDSFQDLVDAKNPEIWTKFELNRVTEEGLSKEFYKDSAKRLDVPELKNFLLRTYKFLPGVESMLSILRECGIRMHAFSNYPIWFTLIEQALCLERRHGIRWTFVSSCEGLRKPDLRAYEQVAKNAYVDVTDCILIDDRQENCDAALEAGFLAAVRFESAEQVLRELRNVYSPFLHIPEISQHR